MNNQTKLEFRLVPTKGVAFGCGAFRNDLKVVAAAAKKVVAEYRHAFRAIEFAVYCRPGDTANYDAFVSASNYMVVQAEIRCRRQRERDTGLRKVLIWHFAYLDPCPFEGAWSTSGRFDLDTDLLLLGD